MVLIEVDVVVVVVFTRVIVVKDVVVLAVGVAVTLDKVDPFVV